jgi:hypothetical protein
MLVPLDDPARRWGSSPRATEKPMELAGRLFWPGSCPQSSPECGRVTSLPRTDSLQSAVQQAPEKRIGKRTGFCKCRGPRGHLAKVS